MKTIIILSVRLIALIFFSHISIDGFAQNAKPLKEVIKKNGLSMKGTTRSSINGKIMSSLGKYDRFRLISLFPEKAIAKIQPPSRKNYSVNGVTYSAYKTIPDEEEYGSPVFKGSKKSEKSENGLIVCENQDAGFPNFFSGISRITDDTRLWLGAIYKEEDVLRNAYKMLPLERKPVTITLSNDVTDYHSNASLSETVTNANYQADINDAVSKLKQKNKDAVIPANISYIGGKINTAAELSVSMETNVTADLTSLMPELPLSGSSETWINGGISTGLNIVYQQVINPMYTITVSNPYNELTTESAPNDAVYLKSIMYGRVALFFAISARASLEVEAGLKDAISAAELGKAEREISGKAKLLFESDLVYVKVYGGSLAAASRIPIGSFNDLKRYISSTGNTMQDVAPKPILYSFEYVSDGYPMIVRAFTDFTNAECRKIQRIRVLFDKIEVKKAWDFGPTEEIFGEAKITARYKKNNAWVNLTPVKKGDGTNQCTKINPNAYKYIDPTGQIVAQLKKEYKNVFWRIGKSNAITIAEGTGNDKGKSFAGDDYYFEYEVTEEMKKTLEFHSTINLKDRINAEEFIAASDFGKKNGYVRYAEKNNDFTFDEIVDTPNPKIATNENISEVFIWLRFKLM